MLSDYRIPTKSVTLSDGSVIVVRGLSTADLMDSYNRHRLEMEQAFAALQDKTMPLDDKTQIVVRAMQEFPRLVASLIAASANEPDEADTVMLMPIGDQLTLADEIFGMTASDGLVLKNLSRALANLQQKMTRQSDSEKKLSPEQRDLPPHPASR